MTRGKTLLFGAFVALVIFGVMALTVRSTEPWQESNTVAPQGTEENSAAANDMGAIAGALFGPQVIAFEILGILLTAAMIGALVIARPLGAEPDASHYTVPTAAQVRETAAISDIENHPTPPMAASAPSHAADALEGRP